MTNAQTEALTIGPERVSIKQTDGYEVNWYGVVTNEFDENESTTHYIREDIHVTALAARDAELAAVKEMYAREGAKALYELERAERVEVALAEARKALAALDAATVSAIHENDNPNRVIFKDGFVLEGRGADEWLKFMRLIQTVVRRVLEEQGGENNG